MHTVRYNTRLYLSFHYYPKMIEMNRSFRVFFFFVLPIIRVYMLRICPHSHLSCWCILLLLVLPVNHG